MGPKLTFRAISWPSEFVVMISPVLAESILLSPCGMTAVEKFVSSNVNFNFTVPTLHMQRKPKYRIIVLEGDS